MASRGSYLTTSWCQLVAKSFDWFQHNNGKKFTKCRFGSTRWIVYFNLLLVANMVFLSPANIFSGMLAAVSSRAGLGRNALCGVVDNLVTRDFHSTSFASLLQGGLSLPSSKSLWDILKREHIQGHDARHVKDIWQEYHLDPAKNRVATVLPAAKYDIFCETAALTPMFVLPVFRGPNSFETFALQCQTPLVLFTSLEEFKQHGSAATPHMVLSHYTELVDSHKIVLVRGDIIQPHALDPIQAASLMHNAHEFFTDFGAKRELVHTFNRKPDLFDFKRLLDSMGHDTSRLPS